jgi:hypothetical protein
VAAVVCGVVAAVTWQDVAFEGAYLNRSIGAPAYSGVFSSWGDNDAPRVLLGVATGLAAAAVLVVATLVWQVRRGSTAAPRT